MFIYALLSIERIQMGVLRDCLNKGNRRFSILDDQAISASNTPQENKNEQLPLHRKKRLVFWKNGYSLISTCLQSFRPSVLNFGLFFFFASSFHNMIQRGWIFHQLSDISCCPNMS